MAVREFHNDLEVTMAMKSQVPPVKAGGMVDLLHRFCRIDSSTRHYFSL